MRFGVFLLAARFPGQSDRDVLSAAVEAAVAAERAGFDDVWFAEHHFMSYGVCPSPVTLAGYVLGRTERIVVGTAVSVLSVRHPVALAEQAALLDAVAPGRFRLGVGRGGPWVELEVFGTGLDRYEHGFGEALGVLLAALGTGRAAADGPLFRFRAVPVVPGPRPELGQSVVVAATSPGTAALAAQHGLPMLLGLHTADEGKREMIAAYARAARPGTRAGHIGAVLAYVGDTQAGAQRIVRQSLPRWLRPGLAGYVPVDGRPPPSRDPAEYTDLLCRIHPVGAPDYCVQTMAATIERTGIRHLICMVEAAGDPALTRANIARLGTEVLPALRALSSPPVRDAG